jgi:sulfide:quinone oxidoreductase
MKRLLILGAGTAGTIMANKMRKSLPREDWDITIVDQHKTHYYQPGFLFIPFGMYTREDVIKPKHDFFPIGVNVIYEKIDRVEPGENKVALGDGTILNYDFLIIATGTRTVPEETSGSRTSSGTRRYLIFIPLKVLWHSPIILRHGKEATLW